MTIAAIATAAAVSPAFRPLCCCGAELVALFEVELTALGAVLDTGANNATSALEGLLKVTSHVELSVLYDFAGVHVPFANTYGFAWLPEVLLHR